MIEGLRKNVLVRIFGILLLITFVMDGYVISLLSLDHQNAIGLFEAGDFESEEEKEEREENGKEEFQVAPGVFESLLSGSILAKDASFLIALRSCHYREIVTPPPEC